MSKLKNTGFLFFFLLIVQFIVAQDSVKHLTVDEAIALALSGNTAIKTASLDEQIAKAKYRQTDAIFLPQAGFSYTAFTTNNPLNAFGFKLQQQSIKASDFDPSLLNKPSATPDFTTKVEVQQPLLNMDLLYQRKGAAKQIEIAKLSTSRTKDYLSLQTRQAYLQLQMAYDAEKVLKEALVTINAIYKSTKDYYDQGLIQRSDLLNAEVQVKNAEMQLKNNRSNIQDASDMLSLLMGQSPGVVYTTDSIVMNKKILADSLQLSADRADLRAMQKGVEAYDMLIRSQKMSYLPRLNAFAAYQLNDNRMFGFNAGSYIAGVQLSWNIFNGNRTKHSITEKNLEKDKLTRQLEQQKSEAQVQINHAKRQLSDAAFSMQQQLLAAERSAEALRVIRNRYAQGLVKTTDVLMAQTQLSQQQLGYVQAVYNYNLAAAQLQFLSTSSNQ